MSEVTLRTVWPTRPDTPATRADEIIHVAEMEIVNIIYGQVGVPRRVRQELARRVSEVMERARARAAREVEA